MLAGMASAHSEPAMNGRLCVVLVQGGTPWAADIDAGSGVASKVAMLPGVARPVIYSHNRGGVFTIDDQRRFMPFGGEFPSSSVWDHYARAPATGRVLASNPQIGVFAIRPGETPFSRVIAADRNTPFRFSVQAFIERIGKFILGRGNNLYTLDRNNVLARFLVDGPSATSQFRIVSGLPAIDALAVIGERSRPTRQKLFLRFDDGTVVKMLDFDRPIIMNVAIPPGGDVLVVRTNRGTRRLALPRRPHAVTRGQTRIEEAHLGPVKMPTEKYGRYVYRVQAPSIGETLLFSERGLFELSADRGIAPVRLPFDPRKETIHEVAELPASHLAVIFTAADIYALDADGTVTRVPGDMQVGRTLDPNKGVIPVRNEMLVAGARGLFLLADRTLSGNGACAAVDRKPLPVSDICLRRAGNFDDTDIDAFSILGVAPNKRDLLLASEKGPVYSWRAGEPLRKLSWRGIFADGLYPLPWDRNKALLIGSGGGLVVDNDGHYTRVVRSRSDWDGELKSVGTLTSIDTILLRHLSHSCVLRFTPKGTLEALEHDSFDTVVDVPWWKRGVGYDWWNLKLFDADGRVYDAPLTYRGAKLKGLEVQEVSTGKHPIVALASRHWLVFAALTFYVSGPTESWLRVDENFAVHQIPGLAAASEILAAHDRPDAPLLATDAGLFTLDAEGAAHLVPGSPSTPLRVIARSSATGDLLIGGSADLFVYRDGALRVLAPEESIGAVGHIVDIPFAHMTLLETSRGAFAIDASGRLSTVPPLGPGRPHSPLSVQPELRAAYTTGRGVKYRLGTLQQLGRRDAAGACSRPL